MQMAKANRVETRSSVNQPPGFIVPEALYTIEEVKAGATRHGGNSEERACRRSSLVGCSASISFAL